MAGGTPFSDFARVCGRLQAEPSRLRKMEIVASFLRKVEPDERAWAARFLIGHPLPETESKPLNVGGAKIFGLEAGVQGSLAEGPLTVRELGQRFVDVSNIHGLGSVRRREQALASLYRRIATADRPWLLRILSGEMRHGVNEGVVLEAAARAADCSADLVRRAHMLRGDTGEVVDLAFGAGEAGLRNVSLRLFHPMRVMMADVALDAVEALQQHGGRTAYEYKFDGARVIAHKRDEEVRVYSRRLNDVTFSLPEVAEQVRRLPVQECVVEGEVVGVDPKGRLLPFQELMRRFRRVHDLAGVRKQVGLRLHLFDALHVDGQTLLDAPYEERWRRLETIAPSDLLASRLVTGSASAAEDFYRQALEAGHEGVVAKRLDSPYTPGRRGSHWLKVKQVKTLDLVLIGAEWGSGRRSEWLSNYHLAVRVPMADERLLRSPAGAARGRRGWLDGHAMVGKTFKGPTDAEFEDLTRRMLQASHRRESWGVVLEPRFVVEVEYSDLQESPQYESGYALRFARIRRLREDKSPKDADTLGTLHRLAALERGQAPALVRRMEPPSTPA